MVNRKQVDISATVDCVKLEAANEAEKSIKQGVTRPLLSPARRLVFPKSGWDVSGGLAARSACPIAG